jgi:lincosamide and streptogramin A transport system ATP-binding/permease protein
LLIWDEPLNYLDILSREQIETVVLESEPTLVFVEHDRVFVDRVATRRVRLAVETR